MEGARHRGGERRGAHAAQGGVRQGAPLRACDPGLADDATLALLAELHRGWPSVDGQGYLSEYVGGFVGVVRGINRDLCDYGVNVLGADDDEDDDEYYDCY